MSTRVDKGGLKFRPIAGRNKPRQDQSPAPLTQSVTPQPESASAPKPGPSVSQPEDSATAIERPIVRRAAPAISSSTSSGLRRDTPSTTVPTSQIVEHADSSRTLSDSDSVPPEASSSTNRRLRKNSSTAEARADKAPTYEASSPSQNTAALEAADPSSDYDSSSRRSKRVRRTRDLDRHLEEQDDDTNAVRSSRRASSKAPKRTRTAHKSRTPLAMGADDELDPTAVTMAQLCVETGYGRERDKRQEIELNHRKWKETNRSKAAERAMEREARKYGRTVNSDPATSSSTQAAVKDTTDGDEQENVETQIPSNNVNSAPRQETQGSMYDTRVSGNDYNPVVRLQDGELVIDETSLQTGGEDAVEDEGEMQPVFESELTTFTNSRSFSKKRGRSARWTVLETEEFFEIMQQTGLDFQMISYYLPGRDRETCKNKYKAEERKNPHRIAFVLKNRKPLDLDRLAKVTGKDLSGPTPQIAMPELPPPRSNPSSSSVSHAVPKQPSRSRKNSEKSQTNEQRDPDEEIIGDIS